MDKRKTIIVEKPWGQEFHFIYNKICTVKILEINAHAILSYQSHNKRNEFWRCIKNSVKIILNDVEFILKSGDEIFIPYGAKHRIIGTDKTSQILEIILGEYEHEDIVRYEDNYGREGTTRV